LKDEKSQPEGDKKKIKKTKNKNLNNKLDFNDIINLSDKKVKDILKKIEIENLVYAMKGSGHEVKLKIEKNLGLRALKKYHEFILKIKGIKTSDASKYREKIIEEINKSVK